MRYLLSATLLLAGLVFIPLGHADNGETNVTFENLAGWQHKSFKGQTVYTPVREGERTVLHAEAQGSASGLYHDVRVNAGEQPVIRWTWNVPQTLAAEDASRKSGDDYAARVYLIFPGRFFWQTRALVYVWADKLPVGAVVPNPFTANVAVIAVESGNRHAGTWRSEARNYAADFRSYFHREPPDPIAVAVMSDGDNTGSHAEAWYGEISITRE